MSTNFEKISSNKVKLTFVVPAEDFDKALNQAYLKDRSKINVPGFRKGKAPRAVIERMYGEGVFYDDALDAIFPALYAEAIKEHNIDVVDRPQVDVQEIGAGKELKFTAEVFVRPDVTLGEYKNLTVEVEPKEVVTEDEIQARISQDQQKGARTIDVTDRGVDYTDTVNLDYAGSVDGVPFEGGTAQGQTLKIGSGAFIPGFEEQMVGMTVGEEKDLNVTFPEKYHAENLAGKNAVFHVKVNSITKTELPELDDDFAQDNGFDTFDAYKADVAKKLQEIADTNYDVEIENALIEKAVANAQMDIPAAMIDDQLNYVMRDVEYSMMRQGLRMEDYLKYTGQTREQMAQQYRYDVTKGVFVCSVDPDSAADKAGLKLGDVITKMDDKDIASYEDLVAAKKSYSAGDTVTLTVYREGKTIEVELTFDAAPETTETSSPDQSTDNSYNGNGGYGNGGYGNGGNGYYSNPWDFFNNFFGYGG